MKNLIYQTLTGRIVMLKLLKDKCRLWKNWRLKGPLEASCPPIDSFRAQVPCWKHNHDHPVTSYTWPRTTILGWIQNFTSFVNESWCWVYEYHFTHTHVCVCVNLLFKDLILFNFEKFFKSWVVINHNLLGNLQDLQMKNLINFNLEERDCYT
jgi:hypothetical protein